MIRFSRSAFFAAAALTGALAGWFTSAWTRSPDAPGKEAVADRQTVSATSPSSAKAPQSAAGTNAPSLSLSLPELQTAEECRARLEALEKSAPGQHPMIARAERNFLLRRWLELDVESALAEAERRPESDFGGNLFRVWLELDVNSARGAFNQASPAITKKARDVFFMALADKDPALAVREMTSLRWERHQYRDEALEAVFSKWALRDPAAAFDRAFTTYDTASVIKSVVQSWTDSDPAGAWNHLSKQLLHEDNAGNFALIISAMLSALVDDESAASAHAADEINRFITLDNKEFAKADFAEFERQYIADFLLKYNLLAALEWARKLPEDNWLRVQILAGEGGVFATSDPETVLALLKETGGSSQSWKNEGILREAFASLGARDSGHALALLAELPDEQKPHAMGGWLTYAFKADPAAAIEQCRAWLADPVMKQQLTDGGAWAVAFSWRHGSGVQDPGPVLEALPELASAVNGNVMDTWAKADPEAAAEWIIHNAGNERFVQDLKTESVIAEITHSRPEFAAGWVERLPLASALQETAARTLAANWSAFDPEAARAWMETLPAGPLREAAEKAVAPPEPENR